MSTGVVVSGGDLVTALGTDLDTTWEGLLAGRSAIQPITGVDVATLPCRWAAQVTGIDESSLGLPRRESRIMDLHSFILMKCATQALTGGGVGDGGDIGFFAAIGMVDYRPEDLAGAVLAARDQAGGIDYDRFYQDAYREIFPLWPLSMLNNIALCQVAVRLGLRGENTVFSPHADSALQAIAEAAATVAEGRNTAVLAGGVSEKVSQSSLARGLLHGMLATGEKSGCRPFAADGGGSLLGEGGAVVLLETDDQALRRGKAPILRVTGFGNGFGLDDPAANTAGPSSDAIQRAMAQALRRAGRQPGEVDLVITHAEGRVESDGAELAAIGRLFSDTEAPLLFSSKSRLGDLLAGAPAVDLLLAERMLRTGLIPAAADQGELLPGAERLVRQPTETRLDAILINGFSYQGQAASLLVERVRS